MSENPILVTGGSGFIGSHLIPKLMEREHVVFNLARYVTGRYVLGGNVKTFFADLRDYHTIFNVLKHLQPKIVIHLASLSPVSYSYNHPQEVLETNFNGTVNLAEACLRCIPHFKQFIFASTSETYGNQNRFPLTEETPQIPNSPYAVSKVACEHYLQYMRAAYDFPVTIMRCFNTFGRKRNTHFVVERIVTQMLKNEEKTRLGNPSIIRDFLYVEDHVSAYLSVIGKPYAIGNVFNFCTSHATTIQELTEIIGEQTGWQGKVVWNTIPQRPLDIQKLVGSPEKAKNILRWKPKWKLEDGLKETISYWKNKLL